MKNEPHNRDRSRPACAYVRVSTVRQAEHQTSLAEQEAAILRYAEVHGFNIVETYVEPGASATTGRRPVLQKMMADALAQPRRYDAVIVYNFSRFFRDDFEFEAHRRKLAKAKVELLSATQAVGQGPHADLMRSVITSVDAYSSAINGQQVQMTMQGNAAEGFWNGSVPPFGYRTYVAEIRDKKAKKKLEIEPSEAPIVQKIFSLKLVGDARSGGPMGVKKIAARLNEEGLSLRGKPFATGTVYQILKREIYAGTGYYNRTNSKTGEARPPSEWIAFPAPQIIETATFAAVQTLLAAHNPAIRPPRTTSSPLMLAGIATCGHPDCGHGMMLMTGKGGQYRYYTCAANRTRGSRICTGVSIREEKLDDIVIDALSDRLLQPGRLTELLGQLIDLSADADQGRRDELKLYRAEKTRIEGAIHSMYEMIENGFASFKDPIFAERMKTHRSRLERVNAEIRNMERLLSGPARKITPDMIERFGTLMRAKLRSRDSSLRKGYVQSLVGNVTVTRDEVTIHGRVDALEDCASAVLDGKEGPVRSFVQDWRTQRDSNPWPLPSEGNALSS